jgi:hypothetical protein
MPRRTPLEDRVKTYVENNGVDHYYKIGRKAKSVSTMSHMTIAERDRVERMFVRYQEIRGVSVMWPRKGPTIKDCAAFMGVLADAGQGLLDERITKRYFLKLVRNFGVLVSSFSFLFFSFLFFLVRASKTDDISIEQVRMKCEDFAPKRRFLDEWDKAKENIGRGLTTKKRPIIHFGWGDLVTLMNHVICTPPGKFWKLRRTVMMWTTLLFFTGMRPGEAAYTSRHAVDGHYLRVKNLEVRRIGRDDYGNRFSIIFEVAWLKHNRFRGEV